MAREILKFMTVSDFVLQNKILRCITEDFCPAQFLAMLEDYISQSALSSSREEAPGGHDKMRIGEQFTPETKKQNAEEENIVIALDRETKGSIELPIRIKEKEPGGFRIFGGKNRRKKAVQEAAQEAKATPGVKAVPEAAQEAKATPGAKAAQEAKAAPLKEYAQLSPPGIPEKAETVNLIQNDSEMVNETGLKYVGCAHLPQVIEINITEGELFSVGRFDAAVGKAQSSFEFDKKTRAVSRRHAVIERDTEGYKIIDLSSSAGTYINDRKLPPNTPYILESGCRVSFGNSGADYIWEVS